MRWRDWIRQPRSWIELFCLVNLAFLVVDILLAHAVNRFAQGAEWIPLWCSAVGAAMLALGLVLDRAGKRAAWLWLGALVGAAAVVVGVAGLVFHLQSRFFEERTLQSLVYAAPFAAPLAYTGIGLLLVMNRMVPASEGAAGAIEWARWVLLLAAGGFVGNFALSLTDHAQNGFFRWTEWAPVVSSALAIGFVAVPVFCRVSGRFLAMCAAVLVLQVLVGTIGFVLHGMADLGGVNHSLYDNFVYGAPVFAPLLLPNLALLGLIGVWRLGVLAGGSIEGATRGLADPH
ncbi:MAG: hypothetical protein IPJ41_06495 [Phycisphaerales bacterium]|nr:hypothetical protein [Phycisphaerales bacterium]